ncbi:UNVERIFIED_CONTAM: hypothetical protein K2H54_044353 [Gekko kuhli]
MTINVALFPCLKQHEVFSRRDQGRAIYLGASLENHPFLYFNRISSDSFLPFCPKRDGVGREALSRKTRRQRATNRSPVNRIRVVGLIREAFRRVFCRKSQEGPEVAFDTQDLKEDTRSNA